MRNRKRLSSRQFRKVMLGEDLESAYLVIPDDLTKPVRIETASGMLIKEISITEAFKL